VGAVDFEGEVDKYLDMVDECKEVVSAGVSGLRTSSLTKLRELYDKLRSYISTLEDNRVARIIGYSVSSPEYERMYIAPCLFAELVVLYTMEAAGLKDIPRKLTSAEKKLVEKFERFKRFDKLGVEEIKNYIIGNKENIRNLIREFADAIIEDIGEKIIEPTKVSPGLLHELPDARIVSYYIELQLNRLRKIANAISSLMLSEPAWVRRLFADYLEAMLESKEFRAKIKDEVNNIKSTIEDTLRKLEESYGKLLDELRKSVIEELRVEKVEELRSEVEKLRRNNEDLAKKLNEAYILLDKYVKELGEKEEKLKQLSVKYEKEKECLAAISSELENLRRALNEVTSERDRYKKLYEELRVRNSELESINRELVDIIKGVEKKRYIHIDSALRLEVEFISRIEAKLKPPISIYDPINNEYLNISKWSKEYSYINEQAKGPKGCCIKLTHYIRSLKPPFRKIPRLVVEAINLVRPERYEALGYDSDSLTPMEVFRIIEEKSVELAERPEKYLHILIISSPTGFSKEVVESISGEPGRAYINNKLVVVLYDPLEGKVIYNYMDPGIKELIEAIKPYMEYEVFSLVKNLLEKPEVSLICPIPQCERVLGFTLALKYVNEKLKDKGLSEVDIGFIERVFRRLEEEGKVLILPLDEPIACYLRYRAPEEEVVIKEIKHIPGIEEKIIRAISSTILWVLPGVPREYVLAANIAASALALCWDKIRKEAKIKELKSLDTLLLEQYKIIYILCKRYSTALTREEVEVLKKQLNRQARYAEILYVAKRVIDVISYKYPEIARKIILFLKNPRDIEKFIKAVEGIEELKSEEVLYDRMKRLLNELVES